MPNKSRRIASRQAEIASKKRRAPKRSRNDTETLADNINPVGNLPNTVIPPVNKDPDQNSESRANLRSSAPIISGTQDRANSSPQQHNNPYIWGELKRIGVITAIVSSALVLLTFIM